MAAPGWDENGTPAAVSVTFDNLGEAAQLERGASPEDVQAGEHFSVVEILPRLLELLDRHRVAATFFVEGLNAEIYPSALRELAARGHEVGLHAWRHEAWGALPEPRERDLLERGTRALRSLSIEPVGFRPPGGRLTSASARLLRELGYRYHSPAGESAGLADGLAVLPFRWRLMDAYFYVPQFAGLRERNGDPSDPMQPRALRDALVSAIEAQTGGHVALVFHPFLFTVDRDQTFELVSEVLRRVRELERDGKLRCVRMDEAAEWMLGHPDGWAHAPELDPSTWTSG